MGVDNESVETRDASDNACGLFTTLTNTLWMKGLWVLVILWIFGSCLPDDPKPSTISSSSSTDEMKPTPPKPKPKPPKASAPPKPALKPTPPALARRPITNPDPPAPVVAPPQQATIDAPITNYLPKGKVTFQSYKTPGKLETFGYKNNTRTNVNGHRVVDVNFSDGYDASYVFWRTGAVEIFSIDGQGKLDMTPGTWKSNTEGQVVITSNTVSITTFYGLNVPSN